MTLGEITKLATACLYISSNEQCWTYLWRHLRRWNYKSTASFVYLRTLKLDLKSIPAQLWIARWTFWLVTRADWPWFKLQKIIGNLQPCLFWATNLREHFLFCYLSVFKWYRGHLAHHCYCIWFSWPILWPNCSLLPVGRPLLTHYSGLGNNSYHILKTCGFFCLYWLFTSRQITPLRKLNVSTALRNEIWSLALVKKTSR